MLKFGYDLQDHSPTDVPTDLFLKTDTRLKKKNCKSNILISANQSVPLKHIVSVKNSLSAFNAQLFLCL